MSAAPRASALAPFAVRSFRFQWPADLATSWAFEMETLILGWYVLVETGSVLMLTAFAALAYIGTLLAPMFGVMGHRLGARTVLCAMRATYATLATIMMSLALSGVLIPLHVFIIAALMGLVRPSDLAMRYALVGETMPPEHLVAATGVSRTTQDSARMMGALAGAGLVAALGMGQAYIAVASLYAVSLTLTLRTSGAHGAARRAGNANGAIERSSPWHDLKEALLHVWTTPRLFAAILLALMVNLTAFPLVMGLLPYVAKEIHHTNQTGLGYMVASWAFGALLGSITMSRIGYRVRAGRVMLVFCAAWYAMIMVFAQMPVLAAGMAALTLAGFAQSISMIAMSAMLLRTAGEQFRGRVMGIRMLPIYGVPIGLLVAGPLIARFGYPATATLYCLIGLAFTAFIAVRWRAHLWSIDALANAR